jgi:flagellar motor switch protein FliN/FliY
MAALTEDSRDVIVAACQVGAPEASEALSRALDSDLQFSVLESAEDSLAEPASGPGLVVLLDVEGVGAAFVLAADSNLLPDWYAAPDATGESKLTTLAQELGMILLPEDLMPMEFKAAAVPDIAAAVAAGGWNQSKAAVGFSLTCGDNTGTAALLFPLPNGEAVFTATAETPDVATSESVAEECEEPAAHAARPALDSSRFQGGVKDLPSYTRSLLKIRVPLHVTLAETKLPVAKILELGPGSIIQFSKRCEETLSLEVGEHKVAEGEAVKIGEKFGLRITSMKLPNERFWVVKKKVRVS